MLGQIYITAFQVNEANSFDAKAPFLDLNIMACFHLKQLKMR